MATEVEPRRSGRTRKAVKSFAEEQAEQTAAAATASKSGKKRARTSTAPKKSQSAPKHEVLTEITDYTPAAEDEDDYHLEDDEEPSPPPKIAKRSSKKNASETTGQPYGRPPVGTMIEWLPGRMRKQPKVWNIEELKKERGPAKPVRHADMAEARIDKRLANLKPLAPGEEEMRVLPTVDLDDLDEKYYATLDRAMSHKKFVLQRTRGIEENCHAHYDDCPFETILMAGSKGDVYTIRISHLTTCNCQVNLYQKGGRETQCKHVLYVLHQVLRAPEHLKYQQAFLTSELKELFANAPLLPSQIAEESTKDGNRKPIEGECPICFQDFDEEEDLVWCKASCGNNLHAECFKHWKSARTPVTCPFCRAEWEGDGSGKEVKTTVVDVQMPRERGKGGYYNVADQLDYAT